MAFVTSTKQFNQMFSETKSIDEQLMQAIINYLHSHLYIVRIRALYEWIMNGGGLSIFRCRRDMFDDVVEKLGRNRIPFLVVRNMEGDSGFLVQANNKDAIKSLTSEVLEENALACTITSITGLRQILMTEDYTSRGIISLTGLSSSQIYLLEQMAIKQLGATAIGEDRMSDGTYRFSMQGKAAFPRNKNKNLGLLVLQMYMMTLGPGRDKNNMRAMNRYTYNSAIADVLRQGSNAQPVYVVEGKNYLKLSAMGFECGQIEANGGQPTMKSSLVYQRAIPDYEVQLISRLNSFGDPICTTDLSEVLLRATSESRFDLTEEESDRIAAEGKTAAKISEVVMEKTKKDTVMGGTRQYAEKATHLLKEMGRVLAGAVSSTVPLGYSNEAISDVMDEMEDNDINPEDYQQVASKLQTLEIVPIAEKVVPASVIDRVQAIERGEYDRAERTVEEEPTHGGAR